MRRGDRVYICTIQSERQYLPRTARGSFKVRGESNQTSVNSSEPHRGELMGNSITIYLSKLLSYFTFVHKSIAIERTVHRWRSSIGSARPRKSVPATESDMATYPRTGLPMGARDHRTPSFRIENASWKHPRTVIDGRAFATYPVTDSRNPPYSANICFGWFARRIWFSRARICQNLEATLVTTAELTRTSSSDRLISRPKVSRTWKPVMGSTAKRSK